MASATKATPHHHYKQQQQQVVHNYDHVYHESSTNTTVYDGFVSETISRVVQDGMNGTVFTYGQTGSGKTYTMQGDHHGTEGIIQFALRDVFRAIQSDTMAEYSVKLSYMEIYNRELRDLLVDSTNINTKSTNNKEMAPLRIMDEAGIVKNLSETVVTSYNEFLQVFGRGDVNKTVGSTNMNQVSSRSHSILKVTIEKTRKSSGGGSSAGLDLDKENLSCNLLNGNNLGGSTAAMKTTSILSLVDLAGSENAKLTGAEGQRQKEGGMINKRYVYLNELIHFTNEYNLSHHFSLSIPSLSASPIYPPC